MGRKKLLELYRIKEGQFDDINKSLGSARSVAVDPNAQAEKPKPSSDPRVAKAQGSLDKSKSIFDEGTGGTTALNLTDEELQKIKGWALEYREDTGGWFNELLKKIEDVEDDAGGGNTPFSSQSSTRSVGSVGMK